MTSRVPYVWGLSAAVSAVYLKQASVFFPLTSKSGPSKTVKIQRDTGKTGLGLNLQAQLTVDYWSWENVCWPLLVELEGRQDLQALYGTNGVQLAEYLYPLLYSRLAALGRVPEILA